MGHLIITALLSEIDNKLHRARLRNSLLRLLMYISDCHRYTYNNDSARTAAELMRVFAPADDEAHMRVALTTAATCTPAHALTPLFHYCVFLENRAIPLTHDEATVVRRFITTSRARRAQPTPPHAPGPAHTHFAAMFVDAVWAILTADVQTAAARTEDTALWSALTSALRAGMPPPTLRHTVGVLIFTLARTGPSATAVPHLRPQRHVADKLACHTIVALAAAVTDGLHAQTADARKRRRNRRRTLQKKRKPDARGGPRDDLVAADVLKALRLDELVPALGPLASLCAYWAVERTAPRPWADLQLLADALTALKTVEECVNSLVDLTAMKPLVNHLSSKLFAETSHCGFPAVEEDLTLHPFAPCTKHEMLSNIVMHEVPLANIMARSEDTNALRACLKAVNQTAYETIVGVTSQKHMEAYVVQNAKDIDGWSTQADKQSLCKIFSLTVRKVRIMRLTRDLEKVNGGKLLHTVEVAKATKAIATAAPDIDSHAVQTPAQPSAQPDTDSLHDRLNGSELDRRIRKRRRLEDGFTPGHHVTTNTTNDSRLTSNPHQHPVTRNTKGILISPGNADAPAAGMPVAPLTDAVRLHARDASVRDSGARGHASPAGRLRPAGASADFLQRRARLRLSDSTTPMVFAQQVDGACTPSGERGWKPGGDSLSSWLWKILHAEAMLSPPRNTKSTAFWREPPSDEYPQTFCARW